MGSKIIVLVGLLLAMFLLISSEVAARDLAETSNTVDTTSNEAEEINEGAVNDAKYQGGGYPGNGGGYPGNGGGYPGNGGGYPGNGGGRGGRCRYGRCCGRRGNCRCCSYGEKADVEP